MNAIHPANVLQDLALMREANRAQADAPMTVAEAIGKAEFLRVQPECVVSPAEARRVIDALLAAIQSSKHFYLAKMLGEEVFVLRQSDRAAPGAIVTWVRSAEERGCRQDKLRDAIQTWQRWGNQPPETTRWPT